MMLKDLLEELLDSTLEEFERFDMYSYKDNTIKVALPGVSKVKAYQEGHMIVITVEESALETFKNKQIKVIIPKDKKVKKATLKHGLLTIELENATEKKTIEVTID